MRKLNGIVGNLKNTRSMHQIVEKTYLLIKLAYLLILFECLQTIFETIYYSPKIVSKLWAGISPKTPIFGENSAKLPKSLFEIRRLSVNLPPCLKNFFFKIKMFAMFTCQIVNFYNKIEVNLQILFEKFALLFELLYFCIRNSNGK